LEVVDGDDDGSCSREQLEGVEDRDADDPGLGPVTGRPSLERDLESGPLGQWQPIEDGVDVAIEEVCQARERQPDLGRCRSRFQDEGTGVPSRADDRRPERRLADPGFALDCQAARTKDLASGAIVAERGNESIDRRLLGRAPDDLSAHRRKA
jgi:hypothetical protein